MKDNWLNDLDKKVQNAQEQAPEHLWDNIADRLFSADAGKIVPLHPNLQQEVAPKTNRRVVAKLIWAGSAIVAAALLVVFFYPVFYPTQPLVSDPVLSQSSGDGHSVPNDEGRSIPYSGGQMSYGVEEEGVTSGQRSQEKISERVAENPMTMDELPLCTKRVLLDRRIVVSDNSVLPLQRSILDRFFLPTHRDEVTDLFDINSGENKELAIRNLYAGNAEAKNKSVISDRWSIGAYSNRMVGGVGQRIDGYAQMSGERIDVQDYPIDEKNGELISDIVYANAGQEVGTAIQHRRPVAVGLAVQYRVNKKMSLNVGLTYAQASSTLSSGSPANKFTQSQKLNYIGVPIQMNYKVWQKKGVSAYVAAGTILEKSTSGQVTNEYVLEDNVKAVDQEPLKVSPIQLSVNGGIGVEARLTKNMGIYLEPGIRYNMDNKSTVQTIYNQKSVNFNLNIGFRVPLP